ncbi:uncharacterized protein LOC135844972 [Planococcus citri]|uniref:uncharacterized protein LOC135844972 n=1 Tax=Planococcus citri TaxID=170843 RepID=UPI0031FA2B20
MATTSVPVTLEKNADDVPLHTLDYGKLLNKGLKVEIADKLDLMFKKDLLTFSDLDDRVFEGMRESPINEVLDILSQLSKMNHGHFSKEEYLKEVFFKYGPNPAVMAHVLEDSDDFTHIVTSSERTITVFEENPERKNEGYEIFCINIPKRVFEDELLELFNDSGRKEILEIKLMMDRTTNYNCGIAFIIYAEKEAAEEMLKKMDNYEIRAGQKLKVRLTVPDRRQLFVKKSSGDRIKNLFDQCNELRGGLKEITCDGDNTSLLFNTEKCAVLAKNKLSINGMIVDWAKSKEFPFETNNVHVCQVSSLLSYCSCVGEILSEISSLKKEILQCIEIETDKAIIDDAKKKNRIKYACHSLRIENLNTDEQSQINIQNATDYAVARMNSEMDDDRASCNFEVKTLLDLHKILEPGIDKSGIFRDDEDYVYINGIYDIPLYPSPVESIHEEIEECIQLLNKALNTDSDESAVLMAITAKTKFCIIHPFVDGNGRASRALFSAVLEKRNFPAIVIPILESTRYYEALKVAHVSDSQDFTLIYRYLCECVRNSLQEYLKNLML